MNDRVHECVAPGVHSAVEIENQRYTKKCEGRAARTLAALVVFAALSTACLAMQAPEWKSFGSASEGFHILFPNAPETSKNTIPAGSEIYELRSYVSQVGLTALYVGVCNYGAKGRAVDPATLLQGAKAGAVAHVNAHIIAEKKIELGSSPGVAFEAESDQLHFSVRLVFSDGFLYQLMVTSPLNQEYADTDRFLDSFQLIPRPAAPTVVAGVPDWKPYRYGIDGFSADFPKQPTVQKQNISTDAGQFELRTYVAEDSASALITAVCDYGASAAGKDATTLLDGAKTAALESLKAQATSSKKISLGDAKGTEFEAENEAEHISGRIYLRGSNLYQVLVVSPLNTTYADTAHFLDSFRLLDKDIK